MEAANLNQVLSEQDRELDIKDYTRWSTGGLVMDVPGSALTKLNFDQRVKDKIYIKLDEHQLRMKIIYLMEETPMFINPSCPVAETNSVCDYLYCASFLPAKDGGIKLLMTYTCPYHLDF